ncbi:MAG TPA: bifunctional GNAT family N-acetyltransferase/carbon-nitrogen hydrolase family protein [Anaerolineae bacterium]|nr:bifunctional GNAT family N-acetyltransferase/carbon-nitrogen hydrolase family protein [Anaerolineae bacterium]
MTTQRKAKMKVRRWTPEDIPALIEVHQAAYPEYAGSDLESPYYTERNYALQLSAFAEGQLLAEVDGQVAGYATSLIVQLDDEHQRYTYSEITGSGTFSPHTPSGDTLYGADIAVHPEFRGQGVASLLYRERKRILKRYNLRRMLAYGRIPGYSDYAGRITALEYIDLVKQGAVYDPALTAHLRAGYQVRDVMLDFFWDALSGHYSTLLEMPNSDFKPEKRKIAAAPLRRPVRKMRVGAAQYLFRPIKSWDEFERAVEFFVNSADTYHCHFLLLPELFTVQLFSLMPIDCDPHLAIKNLADMTDRYIEMFKSMAMKHRLYIIGGSHPVQRGQYFYNVAHLFTPSGNVYTQDKLHITPSERQAWNIRPGEEVKIFETPLGRIAIQVCYDIEFPELPRLLTLAGVEVIFVPFSTDEKKAYNRVRFTAQARAVENSVYVVISGNAGNLLNRTYLLNYAQSAIFTPSDFEFPAQATAAEADPNVETIVITDLDLTSLAQHRDIGSTRPLYDRRLDLYELRAKVPLKLIRVE